MAAFKFKFKSVQNVKKNLEKKAQKELALIELKINKLKAEQDDLYAELYKQKLDAVNKKKMTDVKFIKDYELYIKRKIEKLQQKIDELLIEKENKTNELIQKSMEHKMFNKLEEKHLKRFNKFINKIEMKDLDEIAIQKFARVKR